ncbi:hypothetical protein JNUCC42_08075 [Brevibacterium sp. JNUCC-42]|nr:hypothetical protein JNUCC42_08075 [Brevibacterium sp. JNUCC-42]
MFRVVNAYVYDENGDPIDRIKYVIVKPNVKGAGAKVKLAFKASSKIRDMINNSLNEDRKPVLNRIVGDLEGVRKRVLLSNVFLILDRQLPTEFGLTDELLIVRGVIEEDHLFLE